MYPDSDTVRVTTSVVSIQLADSVIIHLYRVLLLLIVSGCNSECFCICPAELSGI